MIAIVTQTMIYGSVRVVDASGVTRWIEVSGYSAGESIVISTPAALNGMPVDQNSPFFRGGSPIPPADVSARSTDLELDVYKIKVPIIPDLAGLPELHVIPTPEKRGGP